VSKQRSCASVVLFHETRRRPGGPVAAPASPPAGLISLIGHLETYTSDPTTSGGSSRESPCPHLAQVRRRCFALFTYLRRRNRREDGARWNNCTEPCLGQEAVFRAAGGAPVRRSAWSCGYSGSPRDRWIPFLVRTSFALAGVVLSVRQPLN
jgi:hypothetical protein